MIHYRSPFRDDKNFGKALNHEMSLIPDGEWACLTDYDTCFIHPSFNSRIANHINIRPNTGMFTCYTNRVQRLEQCITGKCDDNSDIRYWKSIANKATVNVGKVINIPLECSGYCMVIKKETWKSVGGFKEGIGCLGVDNEFCYSLFAKNRNILLMCDVFIFHYYRLNEGIGYKDHLL